MKTKPFLKAATGIVAITAILLMVRCKTAKKAGSAEIHEFLTSFNQHVKTPNSDSLLSYFNAGKKNDVFMRLANLLAGKKDFNGITKPIGGINLNVDSAVIKVINDGLVVVSIPATFRHAENVDKQSLLMLTLREGSPHRYKIIAVDARQFVEDYYAFENRYRMNNIDEKKLFNPVTLAAFKLAEKLKSRYDSVLWFQHVAGKPFFYVIKGSIGKRFYYDESMRGNENDVYKMGLVNPELKEIIPAEYDMVHNIGGTIDGLIEVEKGDKKGFYNISGNLIVPVKYDQAFPLNDDENLALLSNGADYCYLKKDFTISAGVPDLKIGDVLSKIRRYSSSYKLSDTSSKNLMEYNSRDEFNSLVVSPSYLVDLQLLPRFLNFQNPLRHTGSGGESDDGEGSLSFSVNFDGAKKQEGGWFESYFHSLVDDYLGARAGLYEEKQVLVVDKKQNKLLSFKSGSYFGGAEGGGALSGACNENSFRSISDNLFEFKTTSALEFQLYNGVVINEGPYYHYLRIVNGKLLPLPNPRLFNCAKYVKMDDSYLNGCFIINNKPFDHMTPEILKFMKNEIYASYGYAFKDKRWNGTFYRRYGDKEGKPITKPEDSLTTIEKYNINWINQKLKENEPGVSTLAAQ
jgi:hypothetical protein